MEFAFSCTEGKNSLIIGANDSYLTLKLVEVEGVPPGPMVQTDVYKGYVPWRSFPVTTSRT
jgi:hypothetical protein